MSSSLIDDVPVLLLIRHMKNYSIWPTGMGLLIDIANQHPLLATASRTKDALNTGE